jgi:acyl-ACP thioesterase
LDIVNHVNSAKYLEWCLNYVDFDIIQNQKIASLEMNYVKELSLNDEITINKNTSETDSVFVIKDNIKTNFVLRITEK